MAKKAVDTEEILAQLSGETLEEGKSEENKILEPSQKKEEPTIVKPVEVTKPPNSPLTQEKFSEYLAKGFIDKDGKPGINSPRFDEIYSEMGDFKRKFTESEENIKLIQEHNKKLEESINVVTDKLDTEEAPDPVTKPKEYAEFVEMRTLKVIDRALAKFTPVTPAIPIVSGNNNAPATPNLSKERLAKLETQITVQEGLHGDYEPMIQITQRDMAADPILRAQISASDDPPKAAYEHGKKRLDASQATNNANVDSGYVEPGAHTLVLGDGNVVIDELTPNQEKVRLALGQTKEAYLRQLNAINDKRKGAM